jgi:hypothetical protein
MFTSKIRVKSFWNIGLLTAIAIAGGQSSVIAEQDNMLGVIGSEQFRANDCQNDE